MPDTSEPSMHENFLKKMNDTILANLSNEQFSVVELASIVGMSRSQLHRKIKHLTSKSVSQYVREVRLGEAMTLLKNEVATASEISYRVGFTSPSYFYKCFQKQYGFPPGEVKKIAIKEAEGENEDISEADNFKENEKNRIIKNSESRNLKIKSIPKISITVILIVMIGLLVYNGFRGEDKILEKSIAVLPFSNLSHDEENQFFADGVVEDLLSRLSRMEGFKVISRTSSEMYRTKGDKSVSQIARELGVSYVLEGSIQRDENKARINVQLINALDDDHIWSDLYDRELNDLFKTQSDIAIQIATELNHVLTNKQTSDLSQNQTTNFKAFEYYQIGRFYWNKRTKEGYDTSLEYFEKALIEDPNYALAYAGMSDTYNLMTLQRHIDKKEGRDKSVELALKALEMDDQIAIAHNSLASIYTYIDWNWAKAESEYLKAIALNPNYSTAHHYYSEHLSIIGQHEKARYHINKALELDPLSFVIHFVSAKLYLGRGNFEESLKEINTCEILNPTHYWIADYEFKLNLLLGNEAGAIEGIKKIGNILGSFGTNQVDSIYRISGFEGLIKFRIASSKRNYEKAQLSGLLGDSDMAMNYLEEAFKEGNISPEFTCDYAFNKLQNNPRFIKIKDEMGLNQN